MRNPRLVLAAHGSSDPRFADVVESIAAQVRRSRPELDVRIGFLDHGPPSIADAVDAKCVVVPLLLSGGFHVRVDIPEQAAGAIVAEAVGPDPLLAVALADRLHEAGYDHSTPVVLAAAGSNVQGARADARAMASHLSTLLGVEVTAAFLSTSSQPRLFDVRAEAVSTYLLAPGAFHDMTVASGAALVSAPIGAHRVVAEIVLARYDAAQVPGRIAPA